MVRLRLQCLVWGCLFTAVHPEPPTPCKQEQYQVNSQCCDLCPPGKKLVNHCTEDTNTECQPCHAGEFLDTLNTERWCHQHKYCDPNLGLRVEREGTLETDATCTCREGLHCTSHTCDSCDPHSSCPPGFGVKHIATGVSDTVCQPCPVGFFSNVSSAFEKCHPWTSCKTKDQAELKAGTNMTDVLCGPWPRTRALVAIPITLGILFAVFFASACISESSDKVVKKPDKKAHPGEGGRKDPEEIIFLDDIPGHNPLAPVQETLHGCQPVTQEDGKESRISVQERQ
ncbi:tumor necrosis factor receptor superfamily member 5 isoform X1 [Elephas maximus indicus]|uniref:tumor necrosis factor receptor superfamily member 5 isoform X1 n=1 Tax=Elephas maximus indicus TaxID=99487 RepID=UPI002116243F|nr:tumor necrosis factor receptor superfamily member 5 isoform X1 [Elephas maximus indicus]